MADDAAKALSKAHLGDLTRARLWWLRQYLDQPDADRSWLAFDKHVLPLVVAADRPEDEVEKLAHILLTASDRMSGDSQLRDTLLQVLQHTFEIMNWTDLAADVESIGDGPEQAELINSKLTPAG